MRVALMSNAHQPAVTIAFTELEEAFFRAGELLSEAEADPPADTSERALDRRRWGPWRWLLTRLQRPYAPASGR